MPTLPAPDFARNGRAPEGWCERHEEVHACCFCGDAGWVREPWGRHDDGRPVRRQAVKLPVLVLCWCRWDARPAFDPKRHRFPAKLAEATLDSWGPGNSRQRIVATNYVVAWPPAKPWLTFLGDTGRGKTGLACGIVRSVFERHGVSGQVWNVVALFDRLKATFNDETATESTEAVMNEMLVRPLLVVDDLGAEQSTRWAEDRVYAILNGRYEQQLPTIVTANDNLPGWQGLSPRVKSRLMDTGSGEVVMFTGPDRRVMGGAA